MGRLFQPDLEKDCERFKKNQVFFPNQTVLCCEVCNDIDAVVTTHRKCLKGLIMICE